MQVRKAHMLDCKTFIRDQFSVKRRITISGNILENNFLSLQKSVCTNFKVYFFISIVTIFFSLRSYLASYVFGFLQALLATSFVPLFSGLLPPRFHGIRYMDGGFSDNLPTLDENTITVSPFCGESDICPRDVSSQLFHVRIDRAY